MNRFAAPQRAARVRDANGKAVREGRRYVLYWAQLYRRLAHNHALDYALEWADRLGVSLVVYEGLRLDYPWASARTSQILIEGMADNAREAARLGVNYWPFVEEAGDTPARGLVRRLAGDACLVVTDDYPAFIVPGQIAALAGKVDVAVHAIDGNSIVPLSLLGEPVKAAAHLRPRIHRLFGEHWGFRADAEPAFSANARRRVEAPFPVWEPPADIGAFVRGLPLDQSVPAVAGAPGGRVAALAVLAEFARDRLPSYADGRSQPDAPSRTAASRLSPCLRNGFLSIQEVIEAVLNRPGPWTTAQINPKNNNKKEAFFCEDANVNAFLDEAITWRDVGYHWHRHRNADIASLARALPEWALATLNKHATDARPHLYSLERLENADTADELWNASQRELVATGRIHNYMRMLWGKKVLEWSPSPEEAYQRLELLNNKYAIDGRDPNSYSGILWTFGLFDRPWPPERQIFGTIRYMSSDNTARKFKMAGYLNWVRSLGSAGKR